jgi:hypothetical protein
MCHRCAMHFAGIKSFDNYRMAVSKPRTGRKKKVTLPVVKGFAD